jgi:hypothetical protein
MLLTARFDDALAYASALHRRQLRKGTAIPYLSHLMTVSALVIEHGGDEDQAIAGLLHDAAEDQGGEATLRRGYDYSADPVLGAALYWRAKRGSRSMPARRDIDPVEMPKLLPHLVLIDHVGDRYRFRLVGSELVYAYGRDYTGHYADEFFKGSRAKNIIGVYGIVRDARRPAFMRSRYETTKDINLIANRCTFLSRPMTAT